MDTKVKADPPRPIGCDDKRKLAAQHRKRDDKGRFIKSDRPVRHQAKPDANFDPVTTMRAVPNRPTGIFRNLDEALHNSIANSRAMRRDPFILECLFYRQLAAAQLAHTVEPQDPFDDRSVEIAETIRQIIDDIPRLTELKRNLLEAVFFGRYATVLEYDFRVKNSMRQLYVRDWVPLHGDKLVYSFDGELGYLVQGPIDPSISITNTPNGRAHMFDEVEIQAVIDHKHFIMDGRFDEPEIQSGLNGVGLRSQIYWAWVSRQELLQWVFQALERYGAGGLQVWFYEHGNPQSEEAVREAAEKQRGDYVLLFPRPIGQEKAGAGLEIHEPAGHNFETFMRLIDDYFNGQIKRMILGQSLSSEPDATGLGSGLAELQGDTLERIIKYDANNLAETITQKLVKVLVRHNFPGVDEDIVKFKIITEKRNPQEFMEAVKLADDMGVQVREAQIREILGLEEPLPEELAEQEDISDQVDDQENQDDQSGDGQEMPVEQNSGVEVQDLALNGAQVNSLLEVVNQISEGLLPLDSGRSLIAAAFPSLPPQLIDRIIGPLDGFKPNKEDNNDSNDGNPPGGDDDGSTNRDAQGDPEEDEDEDQEN